MNIPAVLKAVPGVLAIVRTIRRMSATKRGPWRGDGQLNERQLRRLNKHVRKTP